MVKAFGFSIYFYFLIANYYAALDSPFVSLKGSGSSTICQEVPVTASGDFYGKLLANTSLKKNTLTSTIHLKIADEQGIWNTNSKFEYNKVHS